MTKTKHIKDKAPTLAEMQKFVGGYIQIVYAPNGDYIVMDEEGKLKDKPVNWGATEHWLGKKENYYDYHDVIVGDVMILSGNAKQK